MISGALVALGIFIGDSACARLRSSFRSTLTKGAWTSGRKSNRPLMANPALTRPLGKVESNCCQSAAIIMAVK